MALMVINRLNKVALGMDSIYPVHARLYTHKDNKIHAFYDVWVCAISYLSSCNRFQNVKLIIVKADYTNEASIEHIFYSKCLTIFTSRHSDLRKSVSSKASLSAIWNLRSFIQQYCTHCNRDKNHQHMEKNTLFNLQHHK